TCVMLHNHPPRVQHGTVAEYDSSPQLRADLLAELQQNALLQNFRKFPAQRDDG
ncbi:hypothetical protein M9458_028551, partial [Cirrhinus mrigala]